MFGLLLGCAAATKLTGWFLPAAVPGLGRLYRDRRGLHDPARRRWSIAAVVLFALMPPWWSDPIGGVVRFLHSNLTPRRTQPDQGPVPGHVYKTPNESLPWYNTLVWTVLVTPVGFLALGAARARRRPCARRRSEPIGLLIAGHWAFLMILRALPHTPGHDGVRLFLPAFGILALLGGLGARWLLDRSARWGTAAIVAALAEGIVSVAVMMPVPLSYFSPIVGGLPGATALGMEPTYYWDALSPEARRWLAEHTPEGRTIASRPSRRRGSTCAGPASCRAGSSDRSIAVCRLVRAAEPPGGLLGHRPGPADRRAAPPMSSRSWASPCSGSSPSRKASA